MHVIPSAQGTEIRKIMFKASLGKILARVHLKEISSA
jgi:hypothetical protein